ncbi:hypothetical protein ACTJIJ_01870 [Niabella sp. 22666]|jgi:hypothetical protein|uniref:hypothetical protein n=1 Tax=Niabella sp. 22666 TaxID=3453954 RepID=UPI003F83CC65
MKKSLLCFCLLLTTFFSKAQFDDLTYADGVATAVDIINSLKSSLLNSWPYSNYGYVVGSNSREISAGGTTVNVTTYSYYWSDEMFNISTWNDVSVVDQRNWAFPYRYTNDYFRGYCDAFEGYWFFDDYYFQ